MNKEKDIDYGFQSNKEAGFPPLVQIALMHYICNSKCKKCPVGLVNRGQMGQDKKGEFEPEKRRYFPFEIFRKVADEMGRHPGSILRFHGRGEPLMHPNYVEMIACGKQAGIGTITSFTNAVLLDKKMAEAILDSGLDLLELSIDAHSEELYRDFRGTDYFNQVVENALNFIKLRNARGSSARTRVIVSAVDCPEFQAEKEAFRRFWEACADMVIFRPYHTYGGRLPSLEICQDPESVPCSQLWTRFSINPWGQVNACFNDWSDEEIVGDLGETDQTIAKIWRNDKFEGVRRRSLENKTTLECCKTCLATKNGWIYTYQSLIGRLQAQDANMNLK
ncbi:MAG: radical SAM protein [Minisyncoccia bacterium]